MNQPPKQPGVLTEEESARNLKKLSDGINEAISDAFGPMTAEEKRRLVLARDGASCEALDQGPDNSERKDEAAS